MDKMGCPVVWWNIWYFLFGLLTCHGRCSEISWVLASGWQEQPGDHQCCGWIFWSWGSAGAWNWKSVAAFRAVHEHELEFPYTWACEWENHRPKCCHVWLPEGICIWDPWFFASNLVVSRKFVLAPIRQTMEIYGCVCVCQHGRCGQAGSGYIFLICHQPTKWRDIASKEREISSKHDKANTSWDVLNKVGNNWQHEDTKGKDVDGVYIAKECQRLVGRDRLWIIWIFRATFQVLPAKYRWGFSDIHVHQGTHVWFLLLTSDRPFFGKRIVGRWPCSK